MEEFYGRLGEQIRARRTQQRITQEDMAGRLGLNRTTVVNIEKGRQRLAVHQLVDLADALGCEPAELLPSVDGADAPVQPSDEFVARIRAKKASSKRART